MTTIKCGATTYKVHPAADLFPLMGAAELKELADDITKRGLQEPISRDKAGVIYDGRNRLAACHKAGAQPRFTEVVVDDAVAFVISRNIRRRHLSAKDKRDVIKKLLKLNPEKSDRQIAKQTDSSPTYIGKTRKALEATGDVSTVDTRKDTKGRKQPAAKPKAKAKAIADLAAEAGVSPDKAQQLWDEAKQFIDAVPPKLGPDEPKLTSSAKALREFTLACRTWLPKITDEADMQKARDLTATLTRPRATGSAEISEDERRAEMEKLGETAS
jgi:ParB-like chromosome segregation protein Spo0J